MYFDMFFVPKTDNTTIITQLRVVSEKLEATNAHLSATTAKIEQVIQNYVTRQDMDDLRKTVEARFMESNVADEKFNAVNERLGKIELQLESMNNRQTLNRFTLQNNAVFWFIAIISIVITIMIYLSEHVIFH